MLDFVHLLLLNSILCSVRVSTDFWPYSVSFTSEAAEWKQVGPRRKIIYTLIKEKHEQKSVLSVSNMMFVNLKDHFASQESRTLLHNC